MGFMCCFGSERRSTIKIVSEDGSSRKYKGPLSVKEVLDNHPHLHQYMLFNAETVRKLGTWARPLPDTRLLEPGKLYVLRPPAAAPTPPRSSRFSGGLTEKGPSNIVESDASTRVSSQKLLSLEGGDSARVSSACASSVKKVSFSNKDSSVERRASSLPRKVCFADSAESSNVESPRSVSLPRKVYSLASNGGRASPTRRLLSMANYELEGSKEKGKESAIPCGEEGMTRVKVVITKQQLACLLGGNEEEAVSSSIMASVAAQQNSSREGSSTWRPSLDSILESKPSQTERSLSQKPKDDLENL